MKYELEVVIINYNTKDKCLVCVDSILKHGIAKSENIFVVDNHSPDGSGQELKEQLKGVNVVLSDINGGYSAGINLAMRECDHEYVLVLNPDTVFIENKIDDVLQKMSDDKRIGVVGLNLVSPDGTLQYSARRNYTLLDILIRRSFLKNTKYGKRRSDRHLMKSLMDNPYLEPDWVMGTGMVIRKEAYLDVGGFDERYFLYFEDVDFCRSLWLHNWKVGCLTSAKLIHEHNRESAKGIASSAGKHHLRSMIKYWRKFGIPLI